MDNENQFNDMLREPHEDLLRYSYSIDSLFELSRSLFVTVDPDEILRTCLLSTMGNFGVLRGFIVIIELPDIRVTHCATQGFFEVAAHIGEMVANEIRSKINLADGLFVNLESYKSVLDLQQIECALPIEISDTCWGLMGLGSRIVGDRFSEDEKKLLVTITNSLAVAFRNAESFQEIKRLNDDLVVKKQQLEQMVSELQEAMVKIADYSRHLEKIIAALNVAQEVQQSFLPQKPITHDRYDLAGASVYCDETGGDYFDYIPLPFLGQDAFGIAIGDVSGHGISSALLMAGVRAYLRGRATQPGSAAEIITDLNRLVCSDTDKTCQFMTFLFVVVNPKTNFISWVNAGHDPIYVYDISADQFGEMNRGKGLALGVDSSRSYTEQSATVLSGHILVLTTDGAMEAHNDRNELFGKERFKQIIRSKAILSAEEIVAGIIEAVNAFRDGAPQHDDITLVVLKFNSSGPEPGT
jgi:serine phosphatase RsbU (regulator of sigma subunit)